MILGGAEGRNAFRGVLVGRRSRRWGALLGMDADFYRRSLGGVSLRPGMRALDLGCGFGGLSLALAERAPRESAVVGVDVSEDQLATARMETLGYPCRTAFRRAPVDRLPFPDESFDLVMTSLGLRETPPEVLQGALGETVRVLRTGGRFLLVGWGTGGNGLRGGLWGIFLRFWGWGRNDGHPADPERHVLRGMVLLEDGAVSPMARRRLFRKGQSA